MRTAGRLVLVSIDGLRADALADPSLPLPALDELAARGVRAAGLRPVFPTVTWPCHASLVTGATPARHGVLGNHVFDRKRGEVVEHYGDRTTTPIATEALWDRLAARGEATAALCWPKTRGCAAIEDRIPECYDQPLFEAHAAPGLWRELATAGLPVDRYAAWSTVRTLSPLQDWLTLGSALHVLRHRPPRLMLVHLLCLDSFQHEFGVDSPEARWALTHVDGLVGRLLAALEAQGADETTAIIVCGDHGFVDVSVAHHPNALLVAERLIGLDGSGAVVRRRAWVASNGGSAHVYVLEDAPRHTLDRVRERLGALPGVEVLGPEEFRDHGLPRPDEHPAQGDLVLLAAPGVLLTGHATPEAVAAAPIYRAAHGHSARVPQLAAGLVMAGPGFREGATLGEVAMLDVAPTAARLLGIALPAADGRPVDAALAEP